MMDVSLFHFSAFHFLRPWFLLALIPTWGLFLLVINARKHNTAWESLIDKKLLPYLLISQNEKNTVPGVWHIVVLMTVMVFAVSGPAWQKQARAFSDDQSELMIVVKVSRSMLEKDLRPDRLTRAIYKMEDLLQERSQLRAGLLAYDGSAHLVMPLTSDSKILGSFARTLQPDMMPVKGDALADAIRLAENQFKRSGTIIVITDSVDELQIRKLKNDAQLKKARIVFYAIASAELLNRKQMQDAAAETASALVVISLDDSDIEALLRNIENNFKQAQNEQADYKDGGYYLVPLILLMILPWFRRGFMAEAWRLR